MLQSDYASYDNNYKTSIISCYPNPFNPNITINYSLENKSNVEIEIFDILGRKIRTLDKTIKNKGLHKIFWNSLDNKGIEVSAGIYLVKINHDNKFMSQKITLIKW